MSIENTYLTGYLIDLIIKRYKLSADANTRNNLKKKVESICKSIYVSDTLDPKKIINMWDASRRQFPGRKRYDHAFSERDIGRILSNPDFKKYLLKQVNSDLELFEKESEKHKELCKVKQQLEKEIEYEEALQKEADRDNDYTLHKDGLPMDIPMTDDEHTMLLGLHSREDAKKLKMEMMLEALFLKFFTPIDENMILHDLNYVASFDYFAGVTTPEALKIKKRLENKEYYKEKAKTENE